MQKKCDREMILLSNFCNKRHLSTKYLHAHTENRVAGFGCLGVISFVTLIILKNVLHEADIFTLDVFRTFDIGLVAKAG